MSSALRVEPLGKWPGERTKYPRGSPFATTYAKSLLLLDRELNAVGAGAVRVRLDVREADLRVDRTLRANANPATAAVIIQFTSPKLGAIRFACDRFTRWQDNLRAIALGMESLRRVDRYGITSDGQQYAGFRAIEAAEGARGFETIEAAARYIVELAHPDIAKRLDAGDESAGATIDTLADTILDGRNGDLFAIFYRRAAKTAHPDTGGDTAVMARLTAARAMFEAAQ